METEKINFFLATKSEYFPAEALPMIRERLTKIPEGREMSIYAASYINPILSIILSIVAGGFGIDRFLIGDIGKGLGKLILTCFCGVGIIWVIIDWFLIMNDTRQKNLEKFMTIVSY